MLVITWVAFLCRVNQLSGQSLWRDEVDTLLFAGRSVGRLLHGLFEKGHNGPLYFLLLRPWLEAAGWSEFAVRYLSAGLGVLTIPLSYTLARRLGFSRRIGLLTALLMATSPYLVWYGQEAKMYTLLTVLVLVAMWAYLKALTGQQRRWWVLFVIATSLTFYTHILSPLLLAVYGLITLIYRAELRRRWRGWLISMACLVLPYLPLALWQFSMLADGLSQGHPFYPLRQQIYLLLQLYSTGLIRPGGLPAIILFGFLILAGLLLPPPPPAAAPYPLQARLVLAGWLLAPPLLIYLISLRVPVFEDRYLIYLAPAFYLTAAIGLGIIRRYGRWTAALCLGLALTFNAIGIWQQQRQPIKADFRAAAAYLSRQSPPPAAIIIHMPYLQSTFNYYYHGDYRLLEGLWTNNGKSQAEAFAEMDKLTNGLAEVWLVASESEAWDNRGLVLAWLNKEGVILDSANFMRVTVYHYRLRPGLIDSQSNGQ
jgi:uncharacterized membrane protein